MRAMHALRGLVDTRWQGVSDPHLLRPDSSGRAPSVDIDRPAGPGVGTEAEGTASEEAALGCAGCLRASRYGNCGDPVASGLSDAFRLIAHPAGGLDCPARLPANESEGVAYWRIHAAGGRVDLAVCPPLSVQALRDRHPGALRIEPIAPDDAWRP